MDTERTLRSFLPIRLREAVKKRILQGISAVSSRRRAAGTQRSTGFIRLALPFGMAALFVVMSSGHYLMTAGHYSVGASRHLAVANCATQQVDGVGAGLLFPQERAASNEVADMSGHTNGVDAVGRSHGRENAGARSLVNPRGAVEPRMTAKGRE